jgi:hypothetical protein
MKINTDKVNSLLNQIEASDAILCDDSPYLPSVDVASLVTGVPDNEILEINWHDDEGQEYKVVYTEKNLNYANFVENVINLCDKNGELSSITLYTFEKNELIKNWD